MWTRDVRVGPSGALFAAALLTLMACAGEDPAAPTYIPDSGAWMYMAEGLQTNTCGTGDLFTDGDAEFLLYYNGDGVVTVDRGDTGTFECQLDGADFSCPSGYSGMQAVDGFDATVRWNVRIDGTFTSSTAMSGVQTVSFTCDGEACDLLSTVGVLIPCAYEYAFSATHAGA